MVLTQGFRFYVFDSHAGNSIGMPDMNGKAVLLDIRNIVSLENYLQLLATALIATFFEVVSVTFYYQNSSESQEFMLTIDANKRKLSTRPLMQIKGNFQLRTPINAKMKVNVRGGSSLQNFNIMKPMYMKLEMNLKKKNDSQRSVDYLVKRYTTGIDFFLQKFLYQPYVIQ